MSEQAPDPSTPIPNDDPRCHCAIEPDGYVGDNAVIMEFGDEKGGQGKIAMHLDCPHHGGIVRNMQKAALRGLSITPN